ncbi:MAG: hypothetical protein C4331_00025 [Meiothermus sp.]
MVLEGGDCLEGLVPGLGAGLADSTGFSGLRAGFGAVFTGVLATALAAGLAALVGLPVALAAPGLAETDLAAGLLVLLADRGRAGLAFLGFARLGFLAGVGAFFKMVHLQGTTAPG